MTLNCKSVVDWISRKKSRVCFHYIIAFTRLSIARDLHVAVDHNREEWSMSRAIFQFKDQASDFTPTMSCVFNEDISSRQHTSLQFTFPFIH